MNKKEARDKTEHLLMLLKERRVQIYCILLFPISIGITVVSFDRLEKLSGMGGCFPLTLPLCEYLYHMPHKMLLSIS